MENWTHTVILPGLTFKKCFCDFVMLHFHDFFSVAPVSVNIVNKVDRLVVGRESEIVCRSTGSRPPAHITWYLGGQRLEGGGTESVSIGQRL